MAKPIENPGEPDDYIDGLRHKKPANDKYIGAVHDPPLSRQTQSTQPKKGIDNVPQGMVKYVLVGAAMAASCALGAIAGPGRSDNTIQVVKPYRPEPQPTVRITILQTVPANLSETCRRALDGTKNYLDAAATIASVNNKQLDIFAEAYRAILQRDWEKLNALSDRQRELERTLAQPYAKLLPDYETLKKDIQACESQGH